MAAISSAPVIPWRQRKRRVFFALTPLIDVMFLLLIFFMLSSQISPYSLVPIGGLARADGGAAANSAGSTSAPMVVRVSHETIRFGSETVALEDLQSAAQHSVAQGTENFLLTPSASANVQDIVTVLEALKAAAAKSVTLVSSRRARP